MMTRSSAPEEELNHISPASSPLTSSPPSPSCRAAFKNQKNKYSFFDLSPSPPAASPLCAGGLVSGADPPAAHVKSNVKRKRNQFFKSITIRRLTRMR
jgi:hypothetical protein